MGTKVDEVVVDVVQALRARGMSFVTDGARLGVRPAGVLSDAERRLLLEHRGEVIAWLQRENAAAEVVMLWPSLLPNHGRRRTGPFTKCALCGAGTWVRFGQTPFCLSCTTEASLDAHAQTLRDLLAAAFRVNASGASFDLAEFISDQIAGLVDEVGPTRAKRIIINAAYEWFCKTRSCPWCGTSGTFHEEEPR